MAVRDTIYLLNIILSPIKSLYLEFGHNFLVGLVISLFQFISCWFFKLDWEYFIRLPGVFPEEVVFIFLFLCSYWFLVCYFQCFVNELWTFVLSVRSRSLPDFACLSQLLSTPCIFIGCNYFILSFLVPACWSFYVILGPFLRLNYYLLTDTLLFALSKNFAMCLTSWFFTGNLLWLIGLTNYKSAGLDCYIWYFPFLWWVGLPDPACLSHSKSILCLLIWLSRNLQVWIIIWGTFLLYEE